MTIAAFIVLTAGAVATASPNAASECQQSVSNLVAAADDSSRVVVTLTGSQDALGPLDVSMLPNIEATLFPISRGMFVLTIQIRPSAQMRSLADQLAGQLCTRAETAGARFNGVMAFRAEPRSGANGRERQTAAVMAKFSEK